ncbi:unnamed protein product, partial [Ectocarpus sp. 8 AP-2014]
LSISTHILTEEEPGDGGPLQYTLEPVYNTMGIFRHPIILCTLIHWKSTPTIPEAPVTKQ